MSLSVYPRFSNLKNKLCNNNNNNNKKRHHDDELGLLAKLLSKQKFACFPLLCGCKFHFGPGSWNAVYWNFHTAVLVLFGFGNQGDKGRQGVLKTDISKPVASTYTDFPWYPNTEEHRVNSSVCCQVTCRWLHSWILPALFFTGTTCHQIQKYGHSISRNFGE